MLLGENDEKLEMRSYRRIINPLVGAALESGKSDSALRRLMDGEPP